MAKTPGFSFSVERTAASSRARTGVLRTPHGEIRTPAFLPAATLASVGSLTPDDLHELGAEAILASAHHLYLRPGASVVAGLGGIHHFVGWDGPILTDSGGSPTQPVGGQTEDESGRANLPRGAAAGRRIRPTPPSRLRESGIAFASPVDGSAHLLSPEKSIEIQEMLGADVVLTLDECAAEIPPEEWSPAALARLHRWAVRCVDARRRTDQALFAVVQGGAPPDLVEESARLAGGLPVDGVLIAGLTGQTEEGRRRALDWSVPLLPEGWPRRLTGAVDPEAIFAGVEGGADLLDSTAPTVLARRGLLDTREGRRSIREAAHRTDPRPAEPGCPCYTCRHFSRAYLRHLFAADELLGYRLAAIHNLWFALDLARRIQRAIADGALPELKAEVLARRSGEAPR